MVTWDGRSLTGALNILDQIDLIEFDSAVERNAELAEGVNQSTLLCKISAAKEMKPKCS